MTLHPDPGLLAAHLEFDAVRFARHRCGGELAVRIEYGNEAAGNQVEHPFLHIRKSLRLYARRDDGMVVGHLGIVEHFLRLEQLLAGKRSREPCVILDAFQNLGAFGIDVITQEVVIHTRISSHLLFVRATG